MDIENINFDNLVPEQLNSLIKKIQSTLQIIKTRKKTMSCVAAHEKKFLACPYCGNTYTVKNGHSENGLQNYKCKNCEKKFNDLTGTIFAGCHLTYEQLEIFFQCIADKVSLRKTAKRMNVTKNTVHLLRLKVLDALKENREKMTLTGDIEADEIYRCINLKGTKKEKMPRYSKPRTSTTGNNTRGISNHKVCIISAIDENDNCFLEISGTGPVTSDMIKKYLLPKVGTSKKIITDCKSSYESVALDNNWNLKQVKSNCYTDIEGNNLANVNSLHSGLTNFLSHFRGISTKHLQGYLDWYCFDKFLNYSVEEQNINEYLFKNLVIKETGIFSSNMYDNHSIIDFSEVYADYNYNPVYNSSTEI